MWWEHWRFKSLSNFQICATVLLTRVIMLYIISLRLTFFLNWKFLPFDSLHHFAYSPFYPTHFLYLFIPQWTLRLLLYLGYCKEFAMNMGCIHMFELVGFFSPLDESPEVELLDHMVDLVLNLKKNWGNSNHSAQGFPLFCILANTCYFLSFC